MEVVIKINEKLLEEVSKEMEMDIREVKKSILDYYKFLNKKENFREELENRILNY